MATKKAERAAPAKLPPLCDRLKAQMTGTTGKLRQTSAPIRLRRSPLSFADGCRMGALAVGIAAGFILLLEDQHLNKWQENWILYRS